MQYPRSAGILLHITSLPGPYGNGDLGPQAHAFLDFLAAAGQSIWQILPLSPPSRGNSPYSSYSAYAGNTLLISPTDLPGCDGLPDLPEPVTASDRADYHRSKQIRHQFLRGYSDSQTIDPSHDDEFAEFLEKESYWLRDFALFEAAAEVLGNKDWSRWPRELARRDPAAIADFEREHQKEIRYSQLLQFLFQQQWSRLKSAANDWGIRICGDLPIFVDFESADVWTNQELFQLDRNLRPTSVAGVPPDYFSPTGQKWGNPIYDWKRNEESGFRWWVERFQRSFELFDILRIDHFRGFESYWEIPATAKTAESGKWVPGPGTALFRAVREQLGDLPMVAEDLGMITPEVHRLRRELGLPSMRVLQFGFGSRSDDFHRPESYPRNCFAYTGTHDNETIVGWYREQMKTGSPETRQLLKEYFPVDESDPAFHLQFIESVFQSSADTAIIPMQDWLGLGNEARFNRPATIDGNWLWRLTKDQLTDDLSELIRKQTSLADRSTSSHP